MSRKVTIFSTVFVLLFVAVFLLLQPFFTKIKKEELRGEYWMILHRASNIEYLYFGEPGNVDNSYLERAFKVKSGIPGERPTPLPHLAQREYWLITSKNSSFDNPETAPYFLTLDVPVTENEPYGPVPYEECNGQCNWILPGFFGLHGSGGDVAKLSLENPGSSGCIRHRDEDITYLYNLLDPQSKEVRYYIYNI